MSTPASAKPFVRTTPDAIPSHSQMSGASSKPGWYTRFVSNTKPRRGHTTGVPTGAADATPIRTPLPLTSSYATSDEYSVEPGVRSAKKYRTPPGPNVSPAGLTWKGTASPCR